MEMNLSKSLILFIQKHSVNPASNFGNFASLIALNLFEQLFLSNRCIFIRNHLFDWKIPGIGSKHSDLIGFLVDKLIFEIRKPIKFESFCMKILQFLQIIAITVPEQQKMIRQKLSENEEALAIINFVDQKSNQKWSIIYQEYTQLTSMIGYYIDSTQLKLINSRQQKNMISFEEQKISLPTIPPLPTSSPSLSMPQPPTSSLSIPPPPPPSSSSPSSSLSIPPPPPPRPLPTFSQPLQPLPTPIYPPQQQSFQPLSIPIYPPQQQQQQQQPSPLTSQQSIQTPFYPFPNTSQHQQSNQFPFQNSDIYSMPITEISGRNGPPAYKNFSNNKNVINTIPIEIYSSSLHPHPSSSSSSSSSLIPPHMNRTESGTIVKKCKNSNCDQTLHIPADLSLDMIFCPKCQQPQA